MALVVKDRVRETTSSSGTGAITLLGAVSGFQSFSVIGNSNTTYYAIVDNLNNTWEVGIGTYLSSGPSLSRDTVLESSNSGSLVSFGSGSKDVFCTYPAERSVYFDAANSAITIPSLSSTTVDATTVNATTADLTNLEVSNLKAKDGTSAGSIANSTGVVTLSSVILTTADISGGSLNNATVGATTPSTGSFTTLTATTGNITTVNATLLDSTNLEVTNLKAKDGTSAGSIANSTGVVTLASSVLSTTDINGGTIDGVTIGGASAGAGTFTTMTVNTVISSGAISDGTGNVRRIVQNSKTGAYTLTASDAGKHISITTGGITVNASIFSAGDAVSIYNDSGSGQTITQGSNVTLRLAGTATTGNRTLAQYGIATLLCVTGGANPVFACSGAGLT